MVIEGTVERLCFFSLETCLDFWSTWHPDITLHTPFLPLRIFYCLFLSLFQLLPVLRIFLSFPETSVDGIGWGRIWLLGAHCVGGFKPLLLLLLPLSRARREILLIHVEIQDSLQHARACVFKVMRVGTSLSFFFRVFLCDAF